MNREEYDAMYQMEERHWYFVGKRKIVTGRIADWLPVPCRRILDAGCGTGRTVEELSRFGKVFAVEPFRDAVMYTVSRGNDRVAQGSATALPFPDGTFDLVTSLDVIEHIEDDGAALRELNRVLRPEGVLVITVPAFMSLWSGHDVALHHHRRYTPAELRQKLEGAGFSIEMSSCFNFFLFPAVAAIRLLRRIFPLREDVSDTTKLPPAWFNRLLFGVMALEGYLMRRIQLPFGVSIVAVATKR